MNQTAVQLQPEPEKQEISLHTAEYTALMARATSSVTIMFTSWLLALPISVTPISGWPGIKTIW